MTRYSFLLSDVDVGPNEINRFTLAAFKPAVLGNKEKTPRGLSEFNKYPKQKTYNLCARSFPFA